MLDKLIWLLLVGCVLFVATPESTAGVASSENRASGSAAGLTTLIGIEARLSEEAAKENAALGYDLASDDAVAAKSTANIVGRSAGAREVMWNGKKITNELAESLGTDRRQLGKAVESLKKHYGLPGNHNVTIGRATGDVYDSKTGELLGNVLDEIGKW